MTYCIVTLLVESCCLVGGHARRHGEGFAHAHALLAVGEERVVLDGQVVLERRLRAQQVLQRVLRFAQFGAQKVDRLIDLGHLLHQPNNNNISLPLLHVTTTTAAKTGARSINSPVLYDVTTRLDVGSARARGESRLGDLHGRFLVFDALLQQLNVLLHVEDLLQSLNTTNARHEADTT